MGQIRAAAVAGLFYPDDPGELETAVARYIGDAPVETNTPAPKAVIAPHAGFVYSGAIAGRAYATLRQAAARIERVILLGPAHRLAFSGLAAPEADAFQTPLGLAPVDRAAIDSIIDLPQVSLRDDAHYEEHALEVQLPFLQHFLGAFSLVPLVVGRTDATAVAEVLERLWGGDETLIVISSDLSHFENYETAQGIDRATAEAIEALQPEGIGESQACGRLPVAGLLRVAKQRAMTVERLDLRNSGDTAGARDRVVGYGAWSFHEAVEASDSALLKRRHDEIFRVARASIRHGLAKGKAPAVDIKSFAADLREHRATFITLKIGGRLRGCIGTIAAHRPFVEDLVENAYAAAFRDHRFAPLQEDEAGNVSLSISLLGKPEAMTFKDETDFMAQLRPRIDGLIIRDGDKRAVFLPQVWDDLPDPNKFLSHLKHKAGMPEDHWSAGFEAWRFTSTSTDGEKLEES